MLKFVNNFNKDPLSYEIKLMEEIIQNSHYPIHIDNSLSSLNQFIEDHGNEFSKYFILVDENTHSACIPTLLAKVKSLQRADILEVDAGEVNKNFQAAVGLWKALIENNADRHTLLINLGGGLVSDLGGFVASVFKRGIPFIHIPTSLLGQIDAAVGSKTAIDLDGAKNQIGTFAHPQAVFICQDFLKNLPDREFFSAFGELIKYALIASPRMLDVIINQEISRELEMDLLIRECIEIKNQLVEEDLYEKGKRKILNFGHTIGHALESLSLTRTKRRLLHGEAVALGIIVELYLSVQILNFPEDIQKKIEQYILDNFDLFPIGEADFNTLFDWMIKDKKNQSGNISFVLLEGVGIPLFNQNIDKEKIQEALLYYANL